MNIKYVKSLVFLITSVMINFVAINFSAISLVEAAELVTPQSKTQPLEPIPYDAKSDLMAKLANLDYFSANFTQDVLSDSGEILEQSSGTLAISKPNLANWHTVEPDEIAIVSDGQDVWVYNPWIEQVSVYSLSAAIVKTPILLLTSKDEALWQQYRVTKKTQIQTSMDVDTDSDGFIISAKDTNSQVKSLTLIFASKAKGGELKLISFLDATGQLSHIKLTDFDAKQAPVASSFNFILPEGVQIDDQRAN